MRRFSCVLTVALAMLPAILLLAYLKTISPSAQAVRTTEELFKNYQETIPGTKVAFDMVAIKGGKFLMGSPEGEAGRKADEGPRHEVELRPFWMGKTEVTWDTYNEFTKSGRPSSKPKTPAEKEADAITRPSLPWIDETYGFGLEKHPVLSITHHAAMEYCRWLSLKTGKIYRLPTEAEWEYACRAGTKTAYYFGDDPKSLGDHAWYAKNSEEVTHEVGKKKPNPWGLHDMYGNVCEWCLDHYAKDTYKTYSKDAPTLNPVILPTERRFSHVTRGGSWADTPECCRSAARLGSDKDWMKHDPMRPQGIWWFIKREVVGFRIVRPVEEYDNLKGLKSKVSRKSD